MRNNGTVEGVNFNTSTTTTTTTTTVAHHQHHRCLTVELLTGEQIVIPYEPSTLFLRDQRQAITYYMHSDPIRKSNHLSPASQTIEERQIIVFWWVVAVHQRWHESVVVVKVTSA
ncbi:hypothetical protein Fcan01_22534 [Folsomia candida]|uniref:Uncharacterized protein n=1 Tax=Folsomia candida TaxID=158441 RepID=A0A226DET8_FOLCA|nr:hypothetical protein Fcan01_22534 [Folsomia candida]